MKLKSLLFGSAAVLAAGTGAQAADLPTVEPVEYVRICDVFGTGFFYIPGTETCLKLSGYVRVETRLIFDDEERAEQLNIANPDNVNNYSTRVRGHVNWDARTQTEFGLIRAYIALEGTRGPQSATTDSTEPGGHNSYSQNVELASAFIQVSNDWGTFTAGKFGSFFDFWADYGWNELGTSPGTEDPNLAAWTFAGGNGFSFSISAEDPDSVDRRRTGDDDYEGLQSPDGVANIRVDQGWGSAQIMGVIHPVHDQFAGNDDSGLGWAVGGGLSLGIPGGWSFSTQAGYSEGALHYISGDPDNMGDLDGAPEDDLNTAWAVRAGVTGPVMTNVTAWAQGAFYHFEEDDGTDEYDFIGASGGFAWEPAPGLRMGPEVGYNSVDWSGAFPDDGDYDVWGLMWRMQRSF